MIDRLHELHQAAGYEENEENENEMEEKSQFKNKQ